MLVDYNQIIPGRLWVGSFIEISDSRQLQRMGITVVISLQTDKDLKQCRIPLAKLVKSLEDANIDLRRIPVEDFNREDLALQLPKCVSEIEAALAQGWAKVYLHCTAGVLRSPTVAAAYLIKAHSMPAHEARDLLIEKRDCNPDLELLEKYQNALKGAQTGLGL